MTKDDQWKSRIAKGVRLGVLLFVLLVFSGIASQRHLLSGVSPLDVSLALGCVIFAVSPIFITMGALIRGENIPGPESALR
jgi:hypothetical protein